MYAISRITFLCKPILLIGAAEQLLEKAGIAEKTSVENDAGLLLFADDDAESALESFAEAIEEHRHWERETDPPLI